MKHEDVVFMTREKAVKIALETGYRIRPIVPEKIKTQFDFDFWHKFNFSTIYDAFGWEVEYPKVTITLSQFNDAYNRSCSRDELIKNLGFYE